MLIMVVISYFLSFFVIWYGAGLIVKAIDQISKKINLSSFAVSFFVLGILTSLPEFSVGINSIIDKDPEIFVGNLLGGIIVLFLLIIPILAIVGNGIKLDHQLNWKNLLFALVVIASPSFLINDKNYNFFEALFFIILYFILVVTLEKKKGLLERVKDNLADGKSHFFHDLGKVVVGIIFIFFASNFIVDKTIYFSQLLKVSPFVLSLLFLSLGTNLPELSLAIYSIVNRKKAVAFGDYLGSAAANSFFMGVLVLLNGGKVTVVNHFFRPFIVTVIGLGLFFYFSRSKNNISRIEGLILLLVYVLFLISEIL